MRKAQNQSEQEEEQLQTQSPMLKEKENKPKCKQRPQTAFVQPIKSQKQQERPIEPIDEQMYDSVSVCNDNKLGDVLNLAKNNNKDIGIILDENQDYIRHMFGYCECYTCTCGACKCKFANNPNPFKMRYQNGMHSVYTKDFQPQDKMNMNDLYLEQTTYPTNFTRKPMNNEYETSNQIFLKGHHVNEVAKRFFPKEKIKEQPLFSVSTYQNQFVNWYGAQSPEQKFPERKQAIKQLPFYAQTTYKDSFDPRNCKYKIPELENLPHQLLLLLIYFLQIFNNRGPLPQYLPFQPMSEVQQKYKAYQPDQTYSIYKKPSIKYKKVSFIICNQVFRKSEEFQAYPGTYMSKTKKDFAQQKDPVCNSKVVPKIPFDVIKQKVYNYVRSQQEVK